MLGSFGRGHTVDENLIGQPDDLRGRTIVPDQVDTFRTRMICHEIHQVVSTCTSVGVNGLVGIPDNAHIIAVAEPQLEQSVLERRNILILVDDEVLIAGADFLRDVPVLDHHSDGTQQDVIQINDATFPFDRFVSSQDPTDIGGRNPGHDSSFRSRQGCILFIGDIRDLRPGNLGGQVPYQCLVISQTNASGCLGDHGEPGITHRWQLTVVGARPEELDLAQGGRMNGASLNPHHAEISESSLHRAGGLGGEGHRKGPARVELPCRGSVGDAMGDSASLSRSGTSDDTHRNVEGLSNLDLLRIQCCQDRICRLGSHGDHHRGTHRQLRDGMFRRDVPLLCHRLHRNLSDSSPRLTHQFGLQHFRTRPSRHEEVPRWQVW